MKNRTIAASIAFLWMAGSLMAGVGTAGAAVIYEDDFSGGADSEEEWQFRANVYVDAWANYTSVEPPEGGDNVLVSTETNHFYAVVDELQDLTDIEVTLLWLDTEIEDDIGRDADFGIELRVQPLVDDPEGDATQLYGIEHDGDENDAANIGDPPTHFHLCVRGALDPDTGEELGTISLDIATQDEMPRPTGHVWYWMKFKAVGFQFSGKTWRATESEPAEYQLDAVDEGENYPAGTIGLSTWSGTALIALIRVETVEAPVSDWPLR